MEGGEEVESGVGDRCIWSSGRVPKRKRRLWNMKDGVHVGCCIHTSLG